MMTYMMNKRIYTKPECFLLDEQLDMAILVLSNSNNVDENGNPISGGNTTGGNGDGTGINDAREGSLFDDDYDF